MRGQFSNMPVFSDVLTGLVGAEPARDWLNAAAAAGQAKAMLISLPRLQSVNLAYGKPAGDQVLVEMAHRIREFAESEIGPDTLVARLAGGHFLIAALGTIDNDRWQYLAEALGRVIGKVQTVEDEALHLVPRIALLDAQAGDSGETMIDRLAARLGKRLSVAALFGAGTIAALAERFRQAGRDESRLVRMREGGAQTAIFCIHTWFNDGDLLAYRPLLAYLPPDRPVYGLLPRLTVAGEFERTRVEDLAADCLQQIQELQPHGPYVLCGNSSGGVIAYELAHQLQSLGERVALLALFDSSAPGGPAARPPIEGLGALGRGRYQAGRARAKLLHHVHLVFRLPPREKIRYVRSGSARRRHTAARNRDPQTQRLREASMEPYSPHHPYSGRTLLFWGRYSEAGAPGQPDPRHGWSRLVRDGLEIYRVPSDHFSLLREPLLLREVARVLRARLASAERDVQGPS